MPAYRSRSERWREMLSQIAHRGGSLELSIAQPQGAAAAPDLVWRVRLMSLAPGAMLVEQPCAAGRVLGVAPGTPVTGMIVVGQNRWAFSSRVLAEGPGAFAGRCGLRIEMPERVERCTRRNFERADIAGLRTPMVECWPLLDPASVIPAEVANRALVVDAERTGEVAAGDAPAAEAALVLPEVGPRFHARLANIGGGGMGLIVPREGAAAMDRSRLVWLRVDLRPIVRAPLGITAKIAHTHLDSAQNLYVGLAFEFSFHPAHRDFVVAQMERFVKTLQFAREAA
jgi:hypothetical protein